MTLPKIIIGSINAIILYDFKFFHVVLFHIIRYIIKKHPHYFSFPSGLKINNNAGNNVKDAKRAANMANPVSSPKYIVGIKLDKDNIENPITMMT